MMRFLVISLVLIHGWYDSECCGGMDCHPVPCDELLELSDGIHWKDLVFSGPKVRPSKDAFCHICEDNLAGHRGLCVYIHPMS